MNNRFIHPHAFKVNYKNRESLLNQRSKLLWFTGLSGSGKSTLANEVEYRLHNLGFKTYLLDGDNIRDGINNDLHFSKKDRVENIRRIGEISKLMMDAGLIVLSAFISPFKTDRVMLSSLVGEDKFFEIYVDCPLSICEERDVKGLYKKARSGMIQNFTGIDSPYEIPISPKVHIHSDKENVDESVRKIVEAVLCDLEYKI
jgi:adenylylsulfate kinase